MRLSNSIMLCQIIMCPNVIVMILSLGTITLNQGFRLVRSFISVDQSVKTRKRPTLPLECL